MWHLSRDLKSCLFGKLFFLLVWIFSNYQNLFSRDEWISSAGFQTPLSLLLTLCRRSWNIVSTSEWLSDSHCFWTLQRSGSLARPQKITDALYVSQPLSNSWLPQHYRDLQHRFRPAFWKSSSVSSLTFSSHQIMMDCLGSRMPALATSEGPER